VETKLERLVADYIIGAITNGNADVSKIGINHQFDSVVTSEEVDVSKPDNIIFDGCRRQSGG
jgi:putative hydrolase of the HAD superfamily